VDAEYLTSSLQAKLGKAFASVVRPLERLLSKPDSARNILQELEVFRFLFHDFYMPLEVDWDLSPDTSNVFLEQIRWFDIADLAKAISRKDKVLFSEYITSAFTTDGKEARYVLNTEWNRLSIAVKVSMTAKIGLSSRIDDLAHVS
jgi:hypothetical protein